MADSDGLEDKKFARYIEGFLYNTVLFIGWYFVSCFDYLFRGSKFDYSLFQSEQKKKNSIQQCSYTDPLTYLFLNTIFLIFSAKLVLDANRALHTLGEPLASFVEKVTKALISIKPAELLYLIIPVILIVASYAKLISWVALLFRKNTTFKMQLEISSYYIGNVFMLYSMSNILIFFLTDDSGHEWNLISHVFFVPITMLINIFIFVGMYRYLFTLKKSISSTWLSTFTVYCATITIYIGIPYVLYFLNNIGWSIEKN